MTPTAKIARKIANLKTIGESRKQVVVTKARRWFDSASGEEACYRSEQHLDSCTTKGWEEYLELEEKSQLKLLRKQREECEN